MYIYMYLYMYNVYICIFTAPVPGDGAADHIVDLSLCPLLHENSVPIIASTTNPSKFAGSWSLIILNWPPKDAAAI